MKKNRHNRKESIYIRHIFTIHRKITSSKNKHHRKTNIIEKQTSSKNKHRINNLERNRKI